MAVKIALAGNPNSGKTTLFNALTGANQFVGNWPGVTVEKKEGKLKKHNDVTITDLPGIYSLSPYTPEEIVAGGWMDEDIFYSIPFYELDPAAFEPLEQVKKILLGVDYEALALLGKQIVAGTNYAYLCKATVTAPDAQPYLAVVFVYQTLEGDCELLKIQPIDVGIGASEGDFLDMAVDPPAGPLMGGWTVAQDPTITPELKAVFDKGMEGLIGVNYVPVLYLGSQVVAGTNHAFLCQATVVVPDAQPEWMVVYLYQDLQGEISVLDIGGFDVGAFCDYGSDEDE